MTIRGPKCDIYGSEGNKVAIIQLSGISAVDVRPKWSVLVSLLLLDTSSNQELLISYD